MDICMMIFLLKLLTLEFYIQYILNRARIIGCSI